MEGRVCEEPKPVQAAAAIDSISSQGQTPIASDLEGPQVEPERVQKNPVSGMQNGMGNAKHCATNEGIAPWFGGRTIVSRELKYAKIALNFYEKRQNAEFEILKVLFSNRTKLAVPGVKGDGPWCHVSFIAKPKNSNCSGSHFFGEMVLGQASKEYRVTYCSIYEPSDPGNIDGCVFCPVLEMFPHPPDGCPAGGLKINKLMAKKGCSRRHQGKTFAVLDAEVSEMLEKAKKAANLKYAKIALEFFENSKGAEFEVVDAFQSRSKQVVVPGSNNKSLQEWCHVAFVAKPRNADCINFTPKHFFGELLRDATTGEYNATYCEIFKPSDRKVTHNCAICLQLWKHPLNGYRVGRCPPYSIPEEESLWG